MKSSIHVQRAPLDELSTDDIEWLLPSMQSRKVLRSRVALKQKVPRHEGRAIWARYTHEIETRGVLNACIGH